MEVAAKYQLDGDDGLECLRVHDPTYQKNILVSILASVAIIGIGLVYLALPGGATVPLVVIGIGATILLMGLLQRGYLVRSLRRKWNQIDPVELVASEAGLVATAKGVRSNVEWSRFMRLKEAEKYFLLYKSADLYSIVPMRGFGTQQDIDRFRDLATQGIRAALRAVEQRDEADEGRFGGGARHGSR